MEHALTGLVWIFVLGISAQWAAWKLRLPSILVLLAFGFAAGPLSGLVRPEALLGELFFPVVSLSVALILFEGGLSLRLSEVRQVGRVIRNLVTVGALVTWAVNAVAARLFLQLPWSLATLFGAVLVVSGPTVVLPLLRQVRPGGAVGPILKWEGIVIDPVGAVAAVLTFEAITAGRAGEATTVALAGLARTLLFGGSVGLAGAAGVVLLLRRNWVPDYLQVAVALAAACAGFSVANELQRESGLLAVTVMGVALANQKRVSVRHIIEFKENLRVVLISSVFILLAATLRVEDLVHVGWGVAALVATLLFVGRPACVLVSSLGSELTWRERVFLSWVAPRGIVAAAVASVFALRLAEMGFPQAELMVPLTFTVIVATVAVYGLTAGPLGRRLGVAHPNAQGVLFVGASALARSLAEALQAEGYAVQLVDSNARNVWSARMTGLPAHRGNALSDRFFDDLQLGSLGRVLALTPNDEVNALVGLHCAECFDRSEIYQLFPVPSDEGPAADVPRHLRGRFLFGEGLTYPRLTHLLAEGGEVKHTRLTEAFDYRAFRELHGDRAIPLFLGRPDRTLVIRAVDQPFEPDVDDTLFYLLAGEAPPVVPPRSPPPGALPG